MALHPPAPKCFSHQSPWCLLTIFFFGLFFNNAPPQKISRGMSRENRSPPREFFLRVVSGICTPSPFFYLWARMVTTPSRGISSEGARVPTISPPPIFFLRGVFPNSTPSRRIFFRRVPGMNNAPLAIFFLEGVCASRTPPPIFFLEATQTMRSRPPIFFLGNAQLRTK